MNKNYVPGSMGFAEGFFCTGGMGIPKKDFMKVDGSKARQIVEKLIKEGRNIERAELGLDGDWQENSTIIYDGEFHEYDSYKGSFWATPALIVYFTDSPNESYECYKREGINGNKV